jgi:hypothetical protein
MLSAGNKIGTIKNAFSDVLKLKFGAGKVRFSTLFNLYPMIASKMNIKLNEIKRGIVDNGIK